MVCLTQFWESLNVIPEDEIPQDTISAEEFNRRTLGQQHMLSVDIRKKRKIELTAEEKAQILVEDLWQEVIESPSDEENVQRLNKIGNLCFTKLKDYEKAIEAYSVIVMDHSDSKEVNSAYPNIAVCYNKLGDTESELKTYQEMVKFFPEGTSEYNGEQQGLRGWPELASEKNSL
jgi:tetratricopeptide (TPR) repeat protein